MGIKGKTGFGVWVFCCRVRFGISGTLPSIKGAERGIVYPGHPRSAICFILHYAAEAQLEVIPPVSCWSFSAYILKVFSPTSKQPPQKPEEGTNAAVNVDFSVDANHKIRVKASARHPTQTKSSYKACFATGEWHGAPCG